MFRIRLYLKLTRPDICSSHSKKNLLEPCIQDFADFPNSSGKIVNGNENKNGVGLGADHEKFAENGAIFFRLKITIRVN